jgi:methionine-rich copper-binding protein CopC
MRRLVAASSALFLLFGAEAARAHAFLDRAEPRVGSSVAVAPRQLSLWFTQDLEPAFTTVQVQNSAGARVDQGKPRIGPANVMHVGLKPLPPGTYRVLWHALSVDTHTTEGSFSFHVGSH